LTEQVGVGMVLARCQRCGRTYPEATIRLEERGKALCHVCRGHYPKNARP